MRREQRHHLDQELRRLAPRDRLLLALRFGDERKPKEIAEVLGAPAGAIRKAIHDAIGRLRRRVAARQPELFERPETTAVLAVKGEEP